MEVVIALLVSCWMLAVGYHQVLRRSLAVSRASRQLMETVQEGSESSKVDERSAEFQLGQAGIRTANAELTMWALRWGSLLVGGLAGVIVGFPLAVCAVLGVASMVGARRWLDGRIKGRGRRLDSEIPMAYVRLLAVLRASPDVAAALAEVAGMLELERGGATPLSLEFRLTAAEMNAPEYGREEGLRRMQQRAATTSLANLGLLLERFSQTGGDRFFLAFESAAQNVQGILDARQQAQAKAAEQLQSARIIPVLLGVTLMFFMNDAGFRVAFQMPVVQIALGAAVLVMGIGYVVMGDVAREAV